MGLRSLNPATGEVIAEYPEATPAEVGMILLEASCAFAGWKRTGFAERASKMRAAADLLDQRKEPLAVLMAREMGKPLAQGRGEVEKCAWVCRHYADHAQEMLADRDAKTDAARSFVAFEPLGPVLAVMPWNFPLWQVFRFAAPALMAGNAGLLKHAANVTGAALAIEAVFKDAGFPPPLFRALLIGSERVAGVIEAREVKAVTLTGSTPAGQAVASRAGAVLKKTVLELGGSDPFVVLTDADLAAAAKAAADARLINSGQSCIAAKRFIVVDAVAERFLDLLAAQLSSRRMGDPMDRGTHVGPQARVELRDSLHHQVEESVKHGARLLLGGEVPAGRGAFYPPTLLAGVDKGMPAFDEETFGPVAAVVRAKDEGDAVRLANDSVFGLGASLWTQDRARAKRLAAQIEAGAVFVNGIVKSDPRLPFGGIKRSGYGRELSEYGIREFVNIKSVWIG